MSEYSELPAAPLTRTFAWPKLARKVNRGKAPEGEKMKSIGTVSAALLVLLALGLGAFVTADAKPAKASPNAGFMQWKSIRQVATNAANTITLAAPGAGRTYHVSAVQFSVWGSIGTAPVVTLTDGTTVIWSYNGTTGSFGFQPVTFTFGDVTCADNKALVLTCNDLGSGCQSTLVLVYGVD